MVYAPFIIRLDNTKLYCPHNIVKEALEEGLFHEGLLEDGMKMARKRAYGALCRFRSRNMHVPPDGFVPAINGRRLYGWYGWRWKKILPEEYGIVIDEANMPHPESGSKLNPPRYFLKRLARWVKTFIERRQSRPGVSADGCSRDAAIRIGNYPRDT